MDMIDKIRNNENSPIYLALLIGFLTGLVVGFMISPIKKGIQIGSENRIEKCSDDEA